MGSAAHTDQRSVMIGGKYTYDPADVLGQGGLATVYRGRDLRSRREVAIKRLRHEYLEVPDLRRRFREEARMMRFARHPNLVQLFDHVEEPGGSWIVMELVPGRNLKEIVEEDGPLPVDDVVRILQQVTSALEFLHQRDAIHLDLKPQNILVADDLTTKLIDLGLVQAHGPHQETVDGNTFGTAAYLPPEQGRGGAVDRRTDIYALGCVTYELLTGRVPFVVPEGPNQQQELLNKHVGTIPARPSTYRPDLPDWVNEVVLQAIAKQPSRRFQTATGFSEAAIEGLAGRSPGANEATRTGLLPPRSERNPSVDGVETAYPPGPSVMERAWMAGGRGARRTRRFRGTIWRLALVFAVGNLLLGLVLVTREGTGAIVGPVVGLVPGSSTVVSTDWLNLRDEPGEESTVLAILESGADVQLTGFSRVVDDERWWPVEVDNGGDTISGWVWDDGIASTGFTRTTSLPSRSWQRVNGWVSDARDWLPLGTVPGLMLANS